MIGYLPFRRLEFKLVIVTTCTDPQQSSTILRLYLVSFLIFICVYLTLVCLLSALFFFLLLLSSFIVLTVFVIYLLETRAKIEDNSTLLYLSIGLNNECSPFAVFINTLKVFTKFTLFLSLNFDKFEKTKVILFDS